MALKIYNFKFNSSFYDCTEGDIKIDDQSIKTKRLSSLRKNVSLVSQETTLFDDTILNNIRYANLNASDQEIKEAAKLSYSDEFINLLPNKYNSIIGENGIRLSGGEKQRLSIARAFLKKSKNILDRLHPLWTQKQRKKSKCFKLFN